MNRLVTSFSRSHHSTCRMNAFAERQQQAEKTVSLLKQQLAALIAIAAQKQQIEEQKEIQKLQKENEEAECTVRKLKAELRFYEAQNGVKQVSVPIQSKEKVVEKVAPIPIVVEEKKVASQPKKEKKEKKKDTSSNKENKAPKGADAAAAIDVSRLNLKIGQIIAVEKHPDADSLYVETVEFGEEKPRTILSGLVKHYTLDQMKGRQAIFLCNLKPQKMRGILSEGMIMCASTPEKVEIINPPEGSAIGDRVCCPEFKGEPDAQLNPKKKIWEQVAPDLAINGHGFATYKGHALMIEAKGKCKAPSMTNCPIK